MEPTQLHLANARIIEVREDTPQCALVMTVELVGQDSHPSRCHLTFLSARDYVVDESPLRDSLFLWDLRMEHRLDGTLEVCLETSAGTRKLVCSAFTCLPSSFNSTKLNASMPSSSQSCSTGLRRRHRRLSN